MSCCDPINVVQCSDCYLVISVQVFDHFSPGCLEQLMKLKWCDLFILGLMQCSNQFCLSNMLAAMSTHLSACSRIGNL